MLTEEEPDAARRRRWNTLHDALFYYVEVPLLVFLGLVLLRVMYVLAPT